MTKLQERLYQYIMEDKYTLLQGDEAYRAAWRKRDEAEERLTAELSAGQRDLFHLYMEEDNALLALQLRHVFRETLELVHEAFNAL